MTPLHFPDHKNLSRIAKDEYMAPCFPRPVTILARPMGRSPWEEVSISLSAPLFLCVGAAEEMVGVPEEIVAKHEEQHEWVEEQQACI